MYLDVLRHPGIGLHQFQDKLPYIVGRYPGCAQMHVDLRRRQLFGLHSGQCVHVGLVRRVQRSSLAGLFQFLPDIARQVFFSGLVDRRSFRSHAGHTEHQAGQVLHQFFLRFAGKLLHIRQVDAAVFGKRHHQRLSGGIHMIDHARRADGALCKHIRLACKISFFVHSFQRAQQAVPAVLAERGVVGAAVQAAIFAYIIVILPGKLPLQTRDLIFRQVVHLRLDQFPCGREQFRHALDPLPRHGVGRLLPHERIAAKIDFSVPHTIAVIAHSRVGRNRLCAGRVFFIPYGQRRKLRQNGLQAAHGRAQLFFQAGICIKPAGGPRPVGAADHFHFSADHLRVVDEISVHRDAVCGLAHMEPVGFRVRQYGLPLLQKQDVGGHFGACRRFECGIRQPHRADQVAAGGQVPAHILAFLVHRPACGDDSLDTAHAQLVDILCRKVIVD